MDTQRAAANAYATCTVPCFWRSNSVHAECTVTQYNTAMVLTYGSDKAHRITFTEHSAEPGKLYAPSGPYCGSKQAGRAWVSAGRFAAAVTCGRC